MTVIGRERRRLIVFFFQAEDGIRDIGVTGVQTCALPILPGTYLNGVFERHPMPYAEGGYGYPRFGQSAVDVPNGKVLRLLVGDEPLDLRDGEVRHHDQRLDFRTGILTRRLEWTSPAGRTVRVTSERLVSLTHRAIAAVRYEVEALGSANWVTV